MTLRAVVVRDRLRKLREIVRQLDPLRALGRDAFIADYRHYWLAERGLQLAAEIVLDVGGHILVAAENDSPTDYEDVIEKLGRHRVVSAELHARLRGLGGFRNVLVHAYLDIDEGRVWDHLQDGISDFVAFAREIEAYLARRGA